MKQAFFYLSGISANLSACNTNQNWWEKVLRKRKRNSSDAPPPPTPKSPATGSTATMSGMFARAALTVDVVSLADADDDQQDRGHQREVVLHLLEVPDGGAEVLAAVLEQGVRQLLHEHAREGEHGHAGVLHLALAELLHVDRAELLCHFPECGSRRVRGGGGNKQVRGVGVLVLSKGARRRLVGLKILRGDLSAQRA